MSHSSFLIYLCMENEGEVICNKFSSSILKMQQSNFFFAILSNLFAFFAAERTQTTEKQNKVFLFSVKILGKCL